MSLLTLFVLSLVQAITEFLPVSSSGHLLILREWKGVDGGLGLDVMLHMGTLLALIIYYRKKLLEIIKNFIGRKDNRLLINIIVSSIPAVILGVLAADFFEDTVRVDSVVVVMLFGVGLIMALEKWLLPSENKRQLNELSWNHALIIGLAQATALVPGTSRSGASIIGGRLSGLSNKDAADYAFLIGIPVIAGAGIKILFDSEASQFIRDYPLDTLLGIIITAIFGLFAIDFVLKFLKKSGLKWFGVYRIVLALVLLLTVVRR